MTWRSEDEGPRAVAVTCRIGPCDVFRFTNDSRDLAMSPDRENEPRFPRLETCPVGTPRVKAWRAGLERRDVCRGREQDRPGGEHPQVAGRGGLDVERGRRGRRVRIRRVAFDLMLHRMRSSPVTTRRWSGGSAATRSTLQCITKWLNSQTEQRCPICRGAWEFAQDKNANEDDALGERVLRDLPFPRASRGRTTWTWTKAGAAAIARETRARRAYRS